MDWYSAYWGASIGFSVSILWAMWVGQRDHAQYIAVIDKAIATIERQRQEIEAKHDPH